ncbi:MAG: glycerol-3-phosphate dehydrogenase/oxidase [bacterium]|nr:glycerol-3-phosphate dehydrogenase/oxidase [bacterium]
MHTVGGVRELAVLDETAFDMVVIGGGITGVCVAREASAAGMSVLLVDKGDFGSGTSSATTKYIHGGIRYLENLEVAVVRESLRERRILALAAPHLVRQQRFLMPAWEWSKPGAPVLGLGVGLYGSLAYDRNRDVPTSLRIPRSGWLSKSVVSRDVPWLNTDGLRGAWAYYDTLNLFPERLLLEFLFTAIEADATAVNYCRATGLEFGDPGEDGSRPVTGVRLVDMLNGFTRTVNAPLVVNAAGPWVDEVLAGIRSTVRVLRSKGVHVLLSSIDGMTQADAVFARAPSGGHVIVSPWMGRLLVGPTDTPMTESVDDARVTRSDVGLVLDTLNATLASGIAPVRVDDVIDTTVGVRPLIAAGTGDTYGASRRHEIHDHGPEGYDGLFSILGGKWTTGRATAEHLMRLLERGGRIGERALVSTRHGAVSSAWAWADDPDPFIDAAVRTWSPLGLADDVVRSLLMIYGTRAEDVLQLVAGEPALGARISDRPGVYDIAAQIVWGIEAEGARTMSDLIDRRMTVGSLGGITADEIAVIARWAAPLLGADSDRLARAELLRREATRALWA